MLLLYRQEHISSHGLVKVTDLCTEKMLLGPHTKQQRAHVALRLAESAFIKYVRAVNNITFIQRNYVLPVRCYLLVIFTFLETLN